MYIHVPMNQCCVFNGGVKLEITTCTNYMCAIPVNDGASPGLHEANGSQERVSFLRCCSSLCISRLALVEIASSMLCGLAWDGEFLSAFGEGR